MKFKHDVFKDLTKLEKAYSIAFHADLTIPKTIDECLDQFEMVSIYRVLPENPRALGYEHADEP